MITFHSQQADCARRARKNENAGALNFASQITSSICTVAFTKGEKFDAMFLSRSAVTCHWLVILDRGKPYPLSRQGFYDSPIASRKMRGVPQDGRAMAANHPARNPARSPAQFLTISKRLPTTANATPSHFRASNSRDNSQSGAQPSGSSSFTIRVTDIATSGESSCMTTRRSFGITFSTIKPINYEHTTINTRSRSAAKNRGGISTRTQPHPISCAQAIP